MSNICNLKNTKCSQKHVLICYGEVTSIQSNSYNQLHNGNYTLMFDSPDLGSSNFLITLTHLNVIYLWPPPV